MEDQNNVIHNPFDDGPTKYEKFNYQIGQAHAMALGALFQKLERFESALKEHERAHVVASRAAMNTMEMPPTAEQPGKPN